MISVEAFVTTPDKAGQKYAAHFESGSAGTILPGAAQTIVNPTPQWGESFDLHDSASRIGLLVVADDLLSDAERQFQREKVAFLTLPAVEKARFKSEYVAVRGGRVVDHDRDLYRLTRRVYSGYENVPVYFGFLGEPQPLPTPFEPQR